MLAALRALTLPSSSTPRLSASIGYALAPADAQHPMKLLQLADDAMYAAKHLGKDQVMHCAGVPAVASR
jgi:GGDEF domain-containing protein